MRKLFPQTLPQRQNFLLKMHNFGTSKVGENAIQSLLGNKIYLQIENCFLLYLRLFPPVCLILFSEDIVLIPTQGIHSKFMGVRASRMRAKDQILNGVINLQDRILQTGLYFTYLVEVSNKPLSLSLSLPSSFSSSFLVYKVGNNPPNSK